MIVDVAMLEILHNSATSLELTPMFGFANMEKKMPLKLKKTGGQGGDSWGNAFTEDEVVVVEVMHLCYWGFSVK